VSILKLIDAGVPKDNIMVIHTTMFVVKIILPLVVAKYTSGPKPMNVYLTATPIRYINLNTYNIGARRTNQFNS